jgi:hypothetical protein
LCLRDCTTNTSNFGQVNGKAVIVDFRVEKQPRGYLKEDILDEYSEGKSEYQYSGMMKEAIKTPNDAKKAVMKQSLQDWKLMEMIDRAEMEIVEFVRKCDGTIEFEDDLKRYVQDIKATVQDLMNC